LHHQFHTSTNFIPLSSEISFHVMNDSGHWIQGKTYVRHV
jgi:hypothetical protein